MANLGDTQNNRDVRAQEAASATSSQVQEEREQAVEAASQASETQTADMSVASSKRRRVKKVAPPDEERLMPRPSIWPLALTFSLSVMFLGLAYNPLVLGIGSLLVIGSIIGWGLERR